MSGNQRPLVIPGSEELPMPYDRRALTDDQRWVAEDIASAMPDRHDETCGVWREDGDGCTCPLVMAVADGLDAARVVAIEVERGYDPTTRRGERVVRMPFRPMPTPTQPEPIVWIVCRNPGGQVMAVFNNRDDAYEHVDQLTEHGQRADLQNNYYIEQWLYYIEQWRVSGEAEAAAGQREAALRAAAQALIDDLLPDVVDGEGNRGVRVISRSSPTVKALQAALAIEAEAAALPAQEPIDAKRLGKAIVNVFAKTGTIAKGAVLQAREFESLEDGEFIARLLSAEYARLPKEHADD